MRMRTMQKIGEKKTEKFGTFEFYLDEEGGKVKLVCKNEWRETETTYVGKVQGKNCMSISKMDIRLDGRILHYVALPDSVYDAFQYAKSNFAFRNICLHYAGQSAETGIKWYSLSAEVPREMWRKIAKYFSKFDRDEEDALYGELMGWLTAQPAVVEKILNVQEEFTLTYRTEQAKKRSEEEEKKARELQEKLNNIERDFEYAEYPDPKKEAPEEASKFQPGYEKMRVEGEIQHPTHQENIYGGGEWWVIQKEWIWHIKNNGSDGDCWSLNNVSTGGAGAIGRRIPYSEEIADKIRGFKK